MCEQLKKDVLCLSQTHSQQNPHLWLQHLHAGRDPSGRVSQEGWSKRQAQDIWHEAQELHFHSGDGGEWWVQKVTLQGPTLPGQANVGPRCNHSFTMECLKLGCWGWRQGCFTCQARDGLVEIQVSKHWKERAKQSLFVLETSRIALYPTMYHFYSFLVSSAWAFSGLHINLKIYQAEMGGIGCALIHFRSKLPTVLQVWI